MLSQNRFHYAPTLLAPGSIIEPGNWGRVHRTSPLFPVPDIRTLEMIFEAVRVSEFADTRPSRLTSAFVWNSEADARRWVTIQKGWNGSLYEVEIVTPNPRRQEGHSDWSERLCRRRRPG